MAKSNVIFGGVDLGDCSPDFRLIDIMIGAVEREISTLNPASSDGTLFGSAKDATRAVVIHFEISDDNPAARGEALRRLNMILSSKVPLWLEAPELDDKHLNAICTGFPSPSALEWAGTLEIKFTCPDPFMYSDVDDMDITLAAGGAVEFYIPCSGSVRPIITQELTGALTSPMWDLGNGDYIIIQGSVGPGTLVIDCTTHDVTLDGVSILAQVSLDSTFFEFDPNPVEAFTPYTMTCSAGAAGQMAGKYRWI